MEAATSAPNILGENGAKSKASKLARRAQVAARRAGKGMTPKDYKKPRTEVAPSETTSQTVGGTSSDDASTEIVDSSLQPVAVGLVVSLADQLKKDLDNQSSPVKKFIGTMDKLEKGKIDQAEAATQLANIAANFTIVVVSSGCGYMAGPTAGPPTMAIIGALGNYLRKKHITKENIAALIQLAQRVIDSGMAKAKIDDLDLPLSDYQLNVAMAELRSDFDLGELV